MTQLPPSAVEEEGAPAPVEEEEEEDGWTAGPYTAMQREQASGREFCANASSGCKRLIDESGPNTGSATGQRKKKGKQKKKKKGNHKRAGQRPGATKTKKKWCYTPINTTTQTGWRDEFLRDIGEK